jgi:hypothetical protein
MASEDFTDVANQILLGVLGDNDASAIAARLLGQLLGDAFDLGDKLSKVSDWPGALFGPPAAGGASWASRLAAAAGGGAVPVNVLQNVTDWFAGRPVTAPPNPIAAVSRPTTPRDAIADLIKRLSALPGGGPPDVLSAIQSIRDIYDELWKLDAAAMPSSDKWDPENVVRAIRQAILRWIKILGNEKLPNHPHFRKAINEVSAEISGPLVERMGVAGAFTFGGIAAYGAKDIDDLLRPRSNTGLGIQVHQVLQQEYRAAALRRTNVIVQESTVYLAGTGRPLSRSYTGNLDLTALYWSRDVELLKLSKQPASSPSRKPAEVDRGLRDDNLDLTIGSEWEIKPVRGAFLGVIQEFTYRTFFNLFVALLQDMPEIWAILSVLGPGGLTAVGAPLPPTRHHLKPGLAWEWPELAAKPIREIGGGVTQTPVQTVLLITVDPLPGIVLYLRFDIPAAELALVAKRITDLYQKWAKQKQKEIRVVLVAVTLAIVAVLAIIVVAALVYFAVEAAAAEGIGELVTLLIGLGTALAQQIAELLQRLGDLIGPLRQAFGLRVQGIENGGDGRLCLRFRLNDGTPPDAVRCASATFGMLRLENAPVQVLVAMPGILAAASELAATLIQRRLGGTSAGTTPNV